MGAMNSIQSKERKSFSREFFWGAASSSHQIEGGLKNNWTEWEEKNAKKLLKRSKRAGLSEENFLSNSLFSCDSFNHWKEDVESLKEMNLNAYRFSVEWARVEPEEGVFREEGISYYVKLIKELRRNNIEPLLTTWHWTVPTWLEAQGGVLSKCFVEKYLEYVEFLVARLGEDVKYWITINEPESFAVSHLIGKWPPQHFNPFSFNKLYLHTFVEAHKRAYEIIKKSNPEACVSIAKNCYYFSTDCILLKPLLWFLRKYLVLSYLDRVKNHVDFLGINYYMYIDPKTLFMKKEKGQFSDMGWYMNPSKIYELLRDIYDRYRLSIVITENGLADEKDIHREWWLDETFKALRRLNREGVDLRGYMHWSLLDNFEWDSGFWPKFGLVKIDSKSKERMVKKSGYYYRDLVVREMNSV